MHPVNKFLFKHNPIFIKKAYGNASYATNNFEGLLHPGKFRGIALEGSRLKSLKKPALVAGALGAAGLAAALPAIIKAVKRKRELKRLSKMAQ